MPSSSREKESVELVINLAMFELLIQLKNLAASPDKLVPRAFENWLFTSTLTRQNDIFQSVFDPERRTMRAFFSLFQTAMFFIYKLVEPQSLGSQ